MFKKERDVEPVVVNTNNNKNSIDTVIGEGTVFEGTISAKTALRIDGTISGDIQSQGPIIVGATGKVVGTIVARQIYIAGTIHGNVTAEDRIEFVAGGYLQGDMVTGDLIIEKGAAFDGNCKTRVDEQRRIKSSAEAKKRPAETAKFPEQLAFDPPPEKAAK